MSEHRFPGSMKKKKFGHAKPQICPSIPRQPLPRPLANLPPLATLNPSFCYPSFLLSFLTALPPLDIPSISDAKITHFRVFEQTDGRTDGRMDRRKNPLTEMRGRI